MRRAKLAPGSIPTGSLPTSASHVVPRCFVCDELIKSHRFSTSLLAGRTQYTHSPLPTKIGGYIGDEFVVVVTPQDALCKHCMALINTMDRLELELRQHRYTLTQHLKIKYKLDSHTTKPVNNNEVSYEDVDELDEPEVIELSDEDWTPNKKQKTDSVKHHRCTICNDTYTNLSLFMAHLSQHKRSEKTKVLPSHVASVKSSAFNNNYVQFGQGVKFKCGCCSVSFSDKESLALHMQQHTGPQPKSKAIGVPPSLVNKSTNESYSSVHQVKAESTLPNASLFEDIEQLSQQDIPVTTVGVCTEEEKGRVCLLALLNNGVCSDLSHRTPPACPMQDTSEIPIVKYMPKVCNPSTEQTISITVSIPNVINGGPLTEQKLSVPAISNHSNSTSLSYPVALTTNVSVPATIGSRSHEGTCVQEKKLHGNNSQLSPENYNMNSLSASQNSCLDMPDLCDSSFQDLPKHAVKEHSKEVIKAESDTQTMCNWNSCSPVESCRETLLNGALTPSGREVQNLDMPSLLDDDLLSNDRCQGSLMETKSFVNHEEDSKDRRNNDVQPTGISSKSSAQNASGSVKNSAVVGEQMARDSFDAESMSSDWYFPTTEKDSSSSLGEKKSNQDQLEARVSWLQESSLSVANKKIPSDNDNCNSNGFSITSNPCATLQREDGKPSAEQELGSKLMPFV